MVQYNNITATEAARRLGITIQTLHNWRRRGWLIAHALPNGRFVVPVSEVDRLMKRAGQADGE